jgi:ATP-dependent Clp protease protease subunit
MIESITIDPQIKVRDPSELLMLPRVLRVRSFNEEACKAFAKEMSLAHQTGQNIIPVVIDSYGGTVYSLLSMIDTIEAAKLPVATIAEGKAMSCGAVLLTCGTPGYRYIGPNATLMIHDVTGGSSRTKSEELKMSAREIGRLNKKLWRILEKNTGKEKGALWNMSQDRARTDWYILPKQAVSHGFADYVGVPTFETTVSVKTTLTL